MSLAQRKPLKALFRYHLISTGAIGWVVRLSDTIALKYCSRGEMQSFLHENATYDTIERGSNAPATVMQSFLRLPGLNFMPLMTGGSLGQRLWANQVRDFGHRRCLGVKRLEPTPLVEQWAAELAGAIAWLASIGIAHGDLRPFNLFLDGDEHMKLGDFDRAAPMGSVHPGDGVPWARTHLCHDNGGRRCPDGCLGWWGFYDAQSEQFAFGSILHNIVTGVELYEELGPEALDLLRNRQFPDMGSTPLERLVVRCWNGEFDTLEDLEKETAKLKGARSAGGKKFDEGYMVEMRRKCEELVEGDLKEFVPHEDAVSPQDGGTKQKQLDDSQRRK